VDFAALGGTIRLEDFFFAEDPSPVSSGLKLDPEGLRFAAGFEKDLQVRRRFVSHVIPSFERL